MEELKEFLFLHCWFHKSRVAKKHGLDKCFGFDNLYEATQKYEWRGRVAKNHHKSNRFNGWWVTGETP